MDSNVLFVERLLPTTDGYEASGTVPQILNLKKWFVGAYLTRIGSENSPEDREKVMISPVAIECYKAHGRDFADALYVGGTVYEWKSKYEAAYVRENKNGESKGGYAKTTGVFNDSAIEKFTDNKEHKELLADAVAKGYISFSNIVSGNFDNNPYGIEQVYSVMHYTDWDKIGSSIVSVGQKYVGEYNTSSDISFTNNDIVQYGKCATVSLGAPDIDDDATVVGYTSQEIYYSDPQPIAILQAPPYHDELNVVDGNYQSTGSTGFTVGNGSGKSETHSFTVTAGAIVGVEQSFSLFGLFKTGISFMTEISGGIGYEGTSSTTTTYETDYNVTTTDHVVAMTVPYVRYRYRVMNPSFTTLSKSELKKISREIHQLETTALSSKKKNQINEAVHVLEEYYDNQLKLAKEYGYEKTVKNQMIEMTYSQPGKPTIMALSKDRYNELVMQLNVPDLYISDDVLHNATPGDVASYIWDGNTNTKDYLWGNSDRNDTAAITVSESGSSVSRSISEEKETENAFTWNAGLHQENTMTAGGITVGYSLDAKYEGAKADVKISTTTAHGTVAYIPSDIDSGKEDANEKEIGNLYNFNFNIASWNTKIRDNDCRVIGYEVTPFVDNQKFPPKPVKEVEIIPTYKDGNYEGVKVRWRLEDVNTKYYNLPQSFVVSIDNAGSNQKTVTAAESAVKGEDYYETSFSDAEAPIDAVLEAYVRPSEIPILNTTTSDTIYIMGEDTYESIFASQPNSIYCKSTQPTTGNATISTGINFKLTNFRFSNSKARWQFSESSTPGVWMDLSENIETNDIDNDVKEKLKEYGITGITYNNDSKNHTYALDIQYEKIPRGIKFRYVLPYSIGNDKTKTYYANSKEAEFLYVYDEVISAKLTKVNDEETGQFVLNAQTANGEVGQQFTGGVLKNLSDNAASKNVLLNANQDTKVTVIPGVYQLEVTNSDQNCITSDPIVYYGDQDMLLITTASKTMNTKAAKMRVQNSNAVVSITDIDDITYGESLQLNTSLYNKNSDDPNVSKTVTATYRVISEVTGEDVTNCIEGSTFTPNSAGTFTIYSNLADGDTAENVGVTAIKKINVKASGERYQAENLEKVLGTNLSDIEGVVYGCDKSAEALGLPTTTQIVSDNGTVYDAQIEWNVKDCDYDPAKKSEQTFNVAGSVVLPDNIDNAKNVSTQVSLNVSVNEEAVTITEPELNTSEGVMIKDSSDAEQPSEPEKPGENPGENTTPDGASDPATTQTSNTSIMTDAGDASDTMHSEIGDVFMTGDMNYKVTASGEVQLTGVSNKNIKTIKIPATVQIFGETFKVTSIEAGAFRNMKKLKKVVIGKYVKEIGKEAFYGCKNLKNIEFKTTLLKNKSIGKRAFAKIASKPKFKLPKKQFKKYKKLIQKSKVTSKAKFTK